MKFLNILTEYFSSFFKKVHILVLFLGIILWLILLINLAWQFWKFMQIDNFTSELINNINNITIKKSIDYPKISKLQDYYASNIKNTDWYYTPPSIIVEEPKELKQDNTYVLKVRKEALIKKAVPTRLPLVLIGILNDNLKFSIIKFPWGNVTAKINDEINYDEETTLKINAIQDRKIVFTDLTNNNKEYLMFPQEHSLKLKDFQDNENNEAQEKVPETPKIATNEIKSDLDTLNADSLVVDFTSEDMVNTFGNVRNIMVSNPFAVAKYIKLEDYYINKTWVGYKLLPGVDSLLFDNTSLKSGDILLAVNGRQLINLEPEDVFSDLRTLRVFNLEILRDGIPIILQVNI